MRNGCAMTDKESPATEEMFFRYALRMTRRRVRLVDIVSAMLLMLAVALCGLLAMVVCDHLATGGLSSQARCLMRWGVLAAAGVLGVFTILLPLLKRLSDLYVARMIEKAYPAFRNDLTAAIQLDRDGTVDSGLLEAIHTRASCEAAQANVKGCVYLGGLKLAGALLGVALVVFGVYGLASPKGVADSLARAMGNDAIAPPTHTKIVAVSPADGTVVLAGQEVQFTATIHQPTTPAKLNILRGESEINKPLDEDALTMKQIGGNKTGRKQNKKYRATWRATALAGDVRFQVVCGDGKSFWRRLRVLPTPAIREISLRLQWPGYMRQGVQTVRGGRIDAPAGTTVTLRAEANLPVAHASLELANARKSLIMTTDGTRLAATFRLSGNDRYRIVFQARDVAGEMRTVWYEIVARPDTPPNISLAEPADDMELAANESFRLSGKAADNLGLRSVELVCLQGSSRRVFPLSRHAAPGKPRVPFERQFSVSQLGRPGDLLTCYVRGRDFCPQRPMAGREAGQVGRSRAFTILIGGDDPQIAAQQAAQQQARQDANSPACPQGAEAQRDPACPPGAGGQIASRTQPRIAPKPLGGKPGHPSDGSRPAANSPTDDTLETLKRELQADQPAAEQLETLRQQLDPQNNNTQKQPGDQQDQQEEKQAGQQGEQKPGEQGEKQAGQPGEQGEKQAGQQGEQKPG
ncbi:MAG: hypothetical protein K8S55_04825, partial [Phycisphaerae bacterium]|nr:hypothetical protein [Phycisphaerae bacterium]